MLICCSFCCFYFFCSAELALEAARAALNAGVIVVSFYICEYQNIDVYIA